MKVLLIVHPEMDHEEAMTFAGLTQVLGSENVITYPFKKSYYGLVDDDYILDDGKKGFTSPYEGILPRTDSPQSLTDIKEKWDDINLVIMGTVRTYGIKAMRTLKKEITDWWQPLVFVEGEDSDRIWWELVQEFKPRIYFKREYRKDTPVRYPSNLDFWPPVLPCPFSAINEKIPPEKVTEREISVYSVCGCTHELREKVTKKLVEMNIPKSWIWMDNVFMEPKRGGRNNLVEYYSALTNSKIGVAVRGHGMDTLRFWETAACGALLFTHDNNQVHPNPFDDGKNCVIFKNDLTDFAEKLCYYLEDENECKRVAANGKSHLLKYHTSEKRTKYILENIERLAK